MDLIVLEDEAPLEEEDADMSTEKNKKVRRRRTRRPRRGTQKRRRRRTALYLALIAVLSIGISGFSIYLKNFAESVEKSVEEELSTLGGGENELLRGLLRSQMESRSELERRAKASAPKSLELNLSRKKQ